MQEANGSFSTKVNKKNTASIQHEKLKVALLNGTE
jgi:hypothetical protein